MTSSDARRPLRTRSKNWVGQLNSLLVKSGITPNQISVLSVVFAGVGAASFYFSRDHRSLLLLAAVMIQLRLFANLMDGLVAVEGGKGTATGALYNEIPDRFADVLFLVGAGFATGTQVGELLGWVAAIGSLLTAGVRHQGAALIRDWHDFSGPCAKPHRMFLLTVTALLALFFNSSTVLTAGLGVIIIGTYFTAGRRLRRLSIQLKEAA